ncbi:hypothetical protein K380107A5_08710 [Holdemania massiliensis]|uniref:helix-turn-helix domain-containing protein n=1 Tax=Holdemania massiliensis TaxID=1468449 RepID=UPI0036F39528
MGRVSIDQAIKDAGLKKKYVAEQLDISDAYLSAYLKNSSDISVKNAAIICKLTGKTLDELDFGQEDS